MNYKIVNTNYMGYVTQDISHLKFRPHPTMATIKCDKGTIVVFKNKKCRLMGVKGPLLSLDELPLKIHIDRIMSRTITIDYGKPINLYRFTNEFYEPEIFPALKLKKYHPMNVNVFTSGKIVCTGVRSKDCDSLVRSIIRDIERSTIEVQEA